jgi:NAD+ kinase
MPKAGKTPRVFLIGNAQKHTVQAAFVRLSELLDSKGLLVGSDLSARPERINDTNPDFVISLGGDGTLLGAGQAMGQHQVPLVGVNMGKLGYLADYTVEELEQDLDQILTDPARISRRMMLDVHVTNDSVTNWEGVALNDCVLRVGEPFRTVGLTVSIDGHPVTTIISDGLIIATPTGSTAHNMACGGPIVQPDVDAIVLTPLCPHSLTHRPVVVGPDTTIQISVQKTSAGTSVVLDGKVTHPAPGGSSLVVSKSKTSFQLVRNPRRKPWDLLVQKLKWGTALT